MFLRRWPRLVPRFLRLMPRMADKARAQEKLGDKDKNFSSKTKDLFWIVRKNTRMINDLLQTSRSRLSILRFRLSSNPVSLLDFGGRKKDMLTESTYFTLLCTWNCWLLLYKYLDTDNHKIWRLFSRQLIFFNYCMSYRFVIKWFSVISSRILFLSGIFCQEISELESNNRYYICKNRSFLDLLMLNLK